MQGKQTIDESFPGIGVTRQIGGIEKLSGSRVEHHGTQSYRQVARIGTLRYHHRTGFTTLAVHQRFRLEAGGALGNLAQQLGGRKQRQFGAANGRACGEKIPGIHVRCQLRVVNQFVLHRIDRIVKAQDHRRPRDDKMKRQADNAGYVVRIEPHAFQVAAQP